MQIIFWYTTVIITFINTAVDFLSCSKELNQWEPLTEYGQSKGHINPYLVLECAWRVSNWTAMKEALVQVSEPFLYWCLVSFFILQITFWHVSITVHFRHREMLFGSFLWCPSTQLGILAIEASHFNRQTWFSFLSLTKLCCVRNLARVGNKSLKSNRCLLQKCVPAGICGET